MHSGVLKVILTTLGTAPRTWYQSLYFIASKCKQSIMSTHILTLSVQAIRRSWLTFEVNAKTLSLFSYTFALALTFEEGAHVRE